MMGQRYERKDKMIGYDNVTVENEESRLNLEGSFETQFDLTYDNLEQFNQV